ncbi:hypothetical protein LO772_31020 [Yinghuangia sp. ASG 101]|uniref:alpha/beta hydrolase domain-containing protein n=1 Tax=Yinghuangia sp. ASG 101 TaxID=2896848 RepID=UPI001E6074F1|nr:alpha/beta hydrolase domain-containing protein [Yinghuangia sp. ASG 101]UGQ11187.1 hypothetical protein LO772_31020 [Yinghuangia sp. ASG 101]
MATATALPGRRPSPTEPNNLGSLDFAYDLRNLGYIEEEFLLSGTAHAYELIGGRGGDGQWSACRSASAPFTTRLVVRRPTDSARFSGTVLAEWLNVSGGTDLGHEWIFLHRHLIRRGDAWVGVSAQKAGIDGGSVLAGEAGVGEHLKRVDPARYAGLSHPGDAWAYDIFAQAGATIRDAASGVLGELRTRRLIAAGFSQSATFLTTYVNAIDALIPVIDGFLLHSRSAWGAEFDGRMAPGVDVAATRAERIRDDPRVPVVVLQTETDVLLLGSGRIAQPDSEHVRLWEPAGAAHVDTYLLFAAPHDDGTLPPERLAQLLRPTTQLPQGRTAELVNAAPQHHYVAHAAYESLVRWVAHAAPPPVTPRMNLSADRTGFEPDEHGNATGGIRTPWMDVPTARLSGMNRASARLAKVFGTSAPFGQADVEALYPGGSNDYMQAFAKALDETISNGFILDADRAEILALAEASYPRASQ